MESNRRGTPRRILKDKKITIVAWKTIEDEIGQDIGVFEPIENGENIWAYYRQTSGKEYFAAAAVNAREEAIFIINWRNDIATNMEIEYKGQSYNITRIDDFEGYKKDLKIYAHTKK